MHRTRYVIGLLTLALTVLGVWFLWHLLGRIDERPGVAVRIEFRDARGLRPGADVRYRGVTVGTVRGVQIATDGSKAVVDLLLEPTGAVQASVNSRFWIVAPRFSGITTGATGLDTLVRDSYVAFTSPDPRGSALSAGTLLAGAERPPANLDAEALEPVGHGDLLLTLLVPENHGLRPGSPVVFRGLTTGDVRSVQLAEDGAYVEVAVRIAHRHRRTVTDRSAFWVARPYVSGALLSGFTVSDVSALVLPFVSYQTEPGRGVPVEDGYRVAASSKRPDGDDDGVPARALQREPVPQERASAGDALVLVRIVYSAVELDTFSADDPVDQEGTGVLYLDANARATVVTARSVVDGNYTQWDAFGAAPDIAREQIHVVVPGGPVLRAHRIWVAPDGRDLALLSLEEVPPDLAVTPAAAFDFGSAAIEHAATRSVRADGARQAPIEVGATGNDALLPEHRGAALVVAEHVAGVLGQSAARENGTAAVVRIDAVPEDLRPRQ